MTKRPFLPAHLSASAMCAKLMADHAMKADTTKRDAKSAARRMAHAVSIARLDAGERRLREAARLLGVAW